MKAVVDAPGRSYKVNGEFLGTAKAFVVHVVLVGVMLPDASVVPPDEARI